LPWTHVRKPECAACDAWLVRAQAKRGEATLAVHAVATTYIEREAHPVSGFDPLHRRSYFLNHAKILMPEDPALLEVGTSFVHMQIGPTDIGTGDPDNGVGRTLDPRIGYILYGNLMRTSIYNGFHIFLLRRRLEFELQKQPGGSSRRQTRRRTCGTVGLWFAMPIPIVSFMLLPYPDCQLTIASAMGSYQLEVCSYPN
jgi:hypothetical protein